MRFISEASISKQFVFMAGISLLALIAVASVNALELRKSLLSERQELTRSAVELAYAALLDVVRNAEQSGLDTQSTQSKALDMLSNMRYASDEYFFILDPQGVLLSNPVAPQLVGTNQMGMQDANGVRIVQRLIEQSVKSTPEFVSYLWPKPGSNVAESKLSYATRYAPWGWTIGTGLYLDDIDTQFQQRLIVSALYLLSAIILMMLLALLMVRKNRKSTNLIIEHLGDLQDNHSARVLNVKGDTPRNEFGQILTALMNAQIALVARLEERQKNESARITQVLDQASSPLLLADADGKISYANKPAYTMFATLEEAMRGCCPEFKSADVHGMTLEQLHPEPGIYKARLNGLTGSIKDELQIGAHVLNVVTTRVKATEQSDEGSFVVEWLDVTEQRTRENRMCEQAQIERDAAESIRKRVDTVLSAIDAACAGDLSNEIAVTGDDAVALMGASLGNFMQRMRENITTIGSHAGSMSCATTSLLSTAEDLGKNAEITSNQASTASASAASINQSVVDVASAAEQLSTSIQHIANNTSTATEVAKTAVDLAVSTDHSMRKLTDSSHEIGQVIKAINTIAEQTNLLALNATIEAARAGEAGKGFSVVANEVKELANETARATDNIQSIIASIQSDTESAVVANSSIRQTIDQIHSIQTDIAAAVEQQISTTCVISKSVQLAEESCADVVANVDLTASNAQDARLAATKSRAAVEKLSTMVDGLDELVMFYKVS